MAGTIVYLNGVPSAGKTSIGRALQDALDEPFLLLGVDTFLRMLPRRTFGDGWLMPVPEVASVRPKGCAKLSGRRCWQRSRHWLRNSI